MIPIKQVARLVHINRVLAKNNLDDLIFSIHLFRPVQFAQKLLPWRWFNKQGDVSLGARIRHALEDLGPIFVKLGQMLSTRPDLLPPEIAKELAKLQDKVPPFPGDVAIEVIEAAYGQPIDTVFERFDSTPLASASIAQVHAARLHDGKEVIVKVVRPDIIKTINRDIALLYVLAGLAEKYWQDGRRLRPVEIIQEYEKTIHDELDMQREAASATLLGRNFKHSDLLYVPEIYWPHTRKSVLVMERIYGTPIGDIDLLKAQGIDLVKLSEDGVEIFFTQVFKHNFFHADMHPGNIFVSPKGQYIAVDFGIVGTLNPEDQHYLAENFLAFFNRDYRRVAELHVKSGWVPGGTRIEEFESAIRSVCEPIFEKPLKEISFGQLLLRLFQTARRFDMEVQPQLVLLQKTLFNIEGLGRELNPDLDLWKTAKPFLENWMSQQIGLRAFLTKFGVDAPDWVDKLQEMPNLVYDSLEQMKIYHQTQSARDKQNEKMQMRTQALIRKVYLAMFASILILSGVLFAGYAAQYDLSFLEMPLTSWLLILSGLFVFIYAWPSKKTS
ncbi:MAG TPA: ubiquinone biosynthesis regulatory protein kinase UbiB [Gammaproteobacteria bacterium]|nr:ubiquinone biosynthesis regulatory protein kinase UbiB [Gammaproteobacteria bacterium]